MCDRPLSCRRCDRPTKTKGDRRGRASSRPFPGRARERVLGVGCSRSPHRRAIAHYLAAGAIAPQKPRAIAEAEPQADRSQAEPGNEYWGWDAPDRLTDGRSHYIFRKYYNGARVRCVKI
ncbi:MAG: hypothetical protein GDA56_04300 [Hormoscilla sp. GM7CHS1pb]|nr:hypothetical protein [Hormoscilla sp. GM7CHS1pb]